jgi:hypothetical protein
MSVTPSSINAIATGAVREAFTRPLYWLPALVLLAPTLVLQLAAPTYLRTRLSPSASTVVVGAVLLVWLMQVALPASCALVHARRAGMHRALSPPVITLSLVIGTRVTLGLAALLLPGLWLQVRYAFAPLHASVRRDGTISASLAASMSETRQAQGRLALVACSMLLLSILGQSTIAAIAEAMNTITAVGKVDAQTIFELHFLPHALTSVGAYVWNAGTVTFYALCVSALFDEAHGIVRAEPPANDARRVSRWVGAGRIITASAVAVGALAAAIYKVQQHLF